MTDENEAVKIGASISKDNKGKLSEMRGHAQAIADMCNELAPDDEDETKSIPLYGVKAEA